MKPRLSTLSAPVAVVALSLLAGCGGDDATANGGGPSAGGTTADPGGSGGLGTEGVSTAGVGGAGSGGASTAGVGGAGSDGASTAGVGGAGSGGASTAGVGGGAPAAGASGSGGTVAPTFETFEFIVTQVPCFGAGCHNDDQNPLDLRVDDQLHTRVTSHVSANCGDIPVVNPGKAQQSALVKILKGPCGPTARMPIGCSDEQDGSCVPAEYIDAIEQWIASGAPQE